MITVLLADDHPLIRKGFRLILDAEPDIEVAGKPAMGPPRFPCVRNCVLMSC